MKNTHVRFLKDTMIFLLLGAVAFGAPTPDAAAVPLGPEAAAPDRSGNTSLHRAALRGDADAVEALLAAGADANLPNQAGATPLHYGVGSERVVAALLAHGAKPDAVSSIQGTPLLAAVAREDSFGVVKLLIDAGANINAQRAAPPGAAAGPSVLALAITGGDRRTIDLLLERKALVNPKGVLPPLSSAALAGDLVTAEKLLACGAAIDVVPFGNQGSALNTAFIGGNPHVARLLIEQGADPKIKSPRGYGTTAMVFSAYNDAGDPAIAKLLVERGVDINTANDTGETALSYALKRGDDTELVRFLRGAGAKSPDTAVRHKEIPHRTLPPEGAARTALVREVTQRSVDLLQRSSTAFLEIKRVRDEAKCVSCHQQSLPSIAFGWARERGLHVDEKELGRQLVAKFAKKVEQTERALELDQPTPGATVVLGYDADGLQALHYTSDETTQAMSHYLLGIQRLEGSWPSFIHRMPMEDGAITGTAWSARAIQLYPPVDRASDVENSLRRAREWLRQQRPPTLNERTFQLFGLAWTNETPERMQPFVKNLMSEQRADGGWAQLPGLGSDAWATGTVLNALHKAGVATSHISYQRGVEFLLRTQFDDGSWWVASRTWPFQPHFDAKFPHGKDQWISAAATAWATMALLLTIEPTIAPDRLPNGQQLIANFLKSSAVTATPTVASVGSVPKIDDPADFVREIQPFLERSCVGCHSGAKPKGGFALTSREALLKGGQSGEPAIVPGHADESPLLQQVMDKVEDLEMPPLTRRKKYPALSPEEIARLRNWIDRGAPWLPKPAETPLTVAQGNTDPADK